MVICGAGFGGLSAISRLTRAGLRVTLVDGHLYSTFQPLLYQVATGGPESRRRRLPGGRLRAAVRGDLPARRAGRASTRRRAGSSSPTASTRATTTSSSPPACRPRYYGIKGAAEHTFGLYTRTDAIVLRDHLMAGFERLSVDQTAICPSPWSAAAPPAWSWPARWPSCAAPCSAPPSPTSTRPGCTSGWSRWHRRCSARSTRNCASTPGRSWTSATLTCRLNTRDRRGHRRPGAAGRRRGPAERSHRMGGGRGAPPRPCAGWGLPQGKNGRITVGPDLRVTGPGPDLRRRGHRGEPGRPHAAARPAGPADGAACRGRRSSSWRPRRPPSRSSTTTRAPWPPSGAGPPWSSWPAGCG